MKIEDQINAVKCAITDLTCRIMQLEKSTDPADFWQVATLKARREALSAARDSLSAIGVFSKVIESTK
jgi:hypothetical protein